MNVQIKQTFDEGCLFHFNCRENEGYVEVKGLNKLMCEHGQGRVKDDGCH